MIEVFDLIVKDSAIKRNAIKFLKKIGAFNNNSFSYLIKFKSLRHKLYIIAVV